MSHFLPHKCWGAGVVGQWGGGTRRKFKRQKSTISATPYGKWRIKNCCCSVTKLCLTLWDPMDCTTPGFPVLHYLLVIAQIHVQWVDDAVQSAHPLSPPSPAVFNLSQHQGLFQWVGSLHQWPKYWSFSFNISPSNEYSGWFPLGWTGLISLQSKGLSSLLQHHSLKASILWCSAFFMVQLSHLYMTTGKTIALTRQTFVGKMMSLLFNMLPSILKHSFSSKEQVWRK